MWPTGKAFIVLALLCYGLAGCSPGSPDGSPWSGKLQRDATPLEDIGYQEFVPPSGQGRVVVVLSGLDGPSLPTPIALSIVPSSAIMLCCSTPNTSRAGTVKGGENVRQMIVIL